MNQDKYRSFEDRLRDRVKGEELPFDPSGWDSFKSTYGNDPMPSQPSKVVSGSAGAGLTWIKWLVPGLIVVSTMGYFILSNDSKTTLGEETNIEDNRIKKDANYDLVNEREEQVAQILASENIQNDKSSNVKNITDRNNTGNQSTQDVVGAAERSLSKFLKQDIEDLAKSPSEISKSEISFDGSHGDQKLDVGTPRSVGHFDSDGSNYASYDNHVSDDAGRDKTVDIRNPAREREIENRGNTFSNSVAKVKRLTNSTGCSAEGTNSSTENKLSFLGPSSELEEVDGAKVSRNLLSIDNIPFLQSDYEATNRLDGVTKSEFTIPVRYSKNSFYIGLGFVVAQSKRAGSEDRSFGSDGPNQFSIGYERRFAPDWSLGLRAKFYEIRNLDFSTIVKDYHQISNAFQFIELDVSHFSTVYAELPLYLSYNPLGKRYSFMGGVRLAYAMSNQVSAVPTTNFETNEVIEQVQQQLDASQYLNDLDFGLTFGARYRVWNNLHIEAHYNLSMTDVSNDIFWGEQKDNSSNINISLSYQFGGE